MIRRLAWADACLPFDESQQPTWPQVMHSRRCTHSSPVARHPTPFRLGSDFALIDMGAPGRRTHLIDEGTIEHGDLPVRFPRHEQVSSARGGIGHVSLNRYEVLTWLRRAGEGGLRMSDLASWVVLSPSGVTRAVDQLQRKGLVERCVFEGDKRGSLATLTAAGKAFLHAATRLHLDGVREHFLKHMSRTELKQLANTMEAILDGEGSPLLPLTDSRS